MFLGYCLRCTAHFGSSILSSHLFGHLIQGLEAFVSSALTNPRPTEHFDLVTKQSYKVKF